MALSKTLHILEGLLLSSCLVVACTVKDSEDDCNCCNDECEPCGEGGSEVAGAPGEGGEQAEGGSPSEGGVAGEPGEGGAPPAQGGAEDGGAGAPPAEGGAAPAEGGAPPAEGGAPPAEGGAPPAEGGAPPAEGGSGGAGPIGPTLACEYTGEASPTDSNWDKLASSTYESDETVAIEDGVLHLTDASSVSGTRLMWGRDCFDTFEVGTTYIVEYTVRAVEASDYAGFLLGFGTSTNAVDLTVMPDGLMINGETGCDSQTIDATLDDAMHVIRITLSPTSAGDDDISISLDGTEIATGVQPCPETANEITFGLGSASATGEGYVDQIQAWKE